MLAEQDLKSIRKKMLQDFFKRIRLLKKIHDKEIEQEEFKIDYIVLMSEAIQCFKDLEIIKKRAIMMDHKKVIELLKDINYYEYKKEMIAENEEEENRERQGKEEDLDPLMSLCILSVADMAMESMEYTVYKTFSKGNIKTALEQCFLAIEQKATDKEKSSMRLA